MQRHLGNCQVCEKEGRASAYSLEGVTTIMQVSEFLDSPLRNAWLHFAYLDAYVRRGYHLIDSKTVCCFDIANVSVVPRHRRKGVFKSWLAEIEVVAASRGLAGVFVESIQNEVLVPFLTSQGYSPVPGSLPPSMFKRV